MRKIPTLFRRDPEDLRRVTSEVHPDCRWVLDGEGVATRKYDGTCVRYDGERWWARREVKPGRATPPGYQPVMTDDVTGKTVGWEPIEQSAFATFHAEALGAIVDQFSGPQPGATYELVGPKVNGNPEKATGHQLVRHGFCAPGDDEELRRAPLDPDGLREWLLGHPGWEGVVCHHPDGRMAKLKRRDFPAGSGPFVARAS
ncbi:hypothetical protein [Micromonospora chokoriensis]|uniref:RNA ligase n=1 Tax=Micromonospora chokoriensis TaxID=356851 RepID=A0A1C4UX04_9ACTN|nr:hypothetical protein [Micromonospora chokoriensis]SCE76109.1 hypothetical protein GA0070612_0822 [Micromonospora chokoriensis]